MKMSNMLVGTLREVPAEAEIESHKLMLRAGLMRKMAAGIYNYMPIGLKVLKNIEEIVREEMNAAGAQEFLASADYQLSYGKNQEDGMLMEQKCLD